MASFFAMREKSESSLFKIIRTKFKFCANLRQRQAGRARFGDSHYLPAWYNLFRDAEKLAQAALYTVPGNRIANFFRYGNAIAARLPGCMICENDKMGRMPLFAIGITGQIIPPFADAPLPGDGVGFRRQRLGRQAFAALAPAPVDHLAAMGGGHALKKAMPSGAPDLARLIRSFHCGFLFSANSWGVKKCPGLRKRPGPVKTK